MKVLKEVIRVVLIGILLLAFGGVTCIPTMADLTGTGTIKGKVTDKAGKAVAGADVITDPPTSTATSDKSGYYTISQVPTGTYTVIATSDTMEGSQMVTVAGGGCITPSSTTTANIKLGQNLISGEGGEGEGTEAAISGKITDDLNNSVSGCTVTTNPATTETTTGSDGTYKISNLKVGTYIVTAKKDGYVSADLTIDMKKTITADIKINRIIPTITSINPQGKVVKGRELTINGTNFSATKANNKIKIGDANATTEIPEANIIEATATLLRVTMPNTTATGAKKLTVEVFGIKSAEFDINILVPLLTLDFEGTLPLWESSFGPPGQYAENSNVPNTIPGTKCLQLAPHWPPSESYATLNLSSRGVTVESGKTYTIFVDIKPLGSYGAQIVLLDYMNYIILKVKLDASYAYVYDYNYNLATSAYSGFNNWNEVKITINTQQGTANVWLNGQQIVNNAYPITMYGTIPSKISFRSGDAAMGEEGRFDSFEMFYEP